MSLSGSIMLANKRSTSLRTTIPEGIAVYLDVRAGDRLEWKMISNEDGERISVVRKAKPIKDRRSAKPTGGSDALLPLSDDR